MKNDVGLAIRFFREADKRGLTQGLLSSKLTLRLVELDQSAIARIELQKRYVLDYELAAIASALRVSVAQLFAKNVLLEGLQ